MVKTFYKITVKTFYKIMVKTFYQIMTKTFYQLIIQPMLVYGSTVESNVGIKFLRILLAKFLTPCFGEI